MLLYITVFGLIGIRYDPLGLLEQPDSEETFKKWVHQLTERYGRIYFPFYEGSFEDVKKEYIGRRDESTLLVIYFHADYKTQSQDNVKGILCNKAVAEHFDQPNVITWMAEVSMNSNYAKLASRLGYNGSFPAFCFFGNVKDRLKLIKSVSGEISADRLVNELINLLSAKYENIFKSEDQLIREDQDAAYRRSLEADRKKLAEKKAKEEQQTIEQERLKRLEEERIERARTKEVKLAEIKASLPDEPSSTSSSIVTVSVQLVGGPRATRKFSPSNKISAIYSFTAVQFNILPEEFTLRIPLPLHTLDRQDLTLEEADITSNIKLIAEKV